MIDRNHPAVEALADAIYRELSGQYGDFGTPSKREAHSALTAALPHLTADDLRDTPAGRALMAEAWQEGAMAHAGSTSYMTPGTRRVINEMMLAANPYQETPDE